LRNKTAADNTEGAYVYSDRRHIPIGRRGPAESQLMRVCLTRLAKTDVMLTFHQIWSLKWLNFFFITHMNVL